MISMSGALHCYILYISYLYTKHLMIKLRHNLKTSYGRIWSKMDPMEQSEEQGMTKRI